MSEHDQSAPSSTSQLSPSTPVRDTDGLPAATVLDYWKWAHSNLLDNTERGVLAEYLVGLALDCVHDRQRVEWAAFDLKTSDGIAVEVKSSAYLQAWKQSRPSTISFDIGEHHTTTDGSGRYLSAPVRSADVYVFCVFCEWDLDRANPLDTRQWEFYVCSTRRLCQAVGNQKSIRLGSLVKNVGPTRCGFDELAETVRRETQF